MPLELIIEERGAPARTQVVAADTAFVGRREDCDVVLPYSFVSARHARFQARAGTVLVEDLGSTNGVLVNGEALAPLAPRVLGPGDVVQIEKIAIRARVAEVPARAPEPTYHEIRIPASATPRLAPPLPPPPILATSTPPPVAASTPRVPLPAVIAPPAPPGPRPDATVVSERSDATTAIPLRPLSLPEALQATREPERLRRRARGGSRPGRPLLGGRPPRTVRSVLGGEPLPPAVPRLPGDRPRRRPGRARPPAAGAAGMSGSLRPRLVLLQGDRVLDVREVPIDGEWILGRHADSPILLAERSVSRQHARVFCEAAGVYLEDLGSPNGTWVDGRPVQGVVALRDGNVVRLGQSTNPTPLLLRFEDPGARLLDALAEAPARPTSLPPAPAALVEAPTLVPGSLSAATEGAVQAAVEEAQPELEPERAPEAGPSAPEPFVVEPVAQAAGFVRRLGGRVGPAALGMAALALVAVLVFRYAPEALQKPWQSVQVEPVRIRADGRVALRGSEVTPSSALKITVDGLEAVIEEMQRGQIVFTAPRLPAAEAGVRPVVLQVERRGIVLVRQSLHYETTPKVTGIEPAEAEVGAVVTLRGSGFSSQAGRVSVRFGDRPATVVEAQLTAIRVRVPVVTRSAPLSVPVEVRVAEWSAEPATMRVRPRAAPCMSLAFTAQSVAPGVWALRHPLGPAALVDGGPAGPGGSPPPAIQRALAVLGETFAAAGTDTAAHFEVRGGRREARILAVAKGTTREVGRWGPAVSAHVRSSASSLARLELIPYWNAVVLNEMLNVFEKKQAPRLLPSGARLQPVIQRLHQLNLDGGGQGCPTEEDLETLAPAERAAFEGAIIEAPSDYGDVGGAWEGQLENVFSDQPQQTQLDLRLELSQDGVAVDARAFVYEVRGPGIRWAPPALDGLKGRVRLGAETLLELQATPRPPYHITQVSATLVDGGLDGVFRTSRGREAKFRLRPAGQ